MAFSLVSQPLIPIAGSYDTSGMSRGEPGLPQRFRVGKEEFEVASVLQQWKEYGDCTHGSGERYLRRHGYLIQTVDGSLLKIYFQRHPGKGRRPAHPWWVQSRENPGKA